MISSNVSPKKYGILFSTKTLYSKKKNKKNNNNNNNKKGKKIEERKQHQD